MHGLDPARGAGALGADFRRRSLSVLNRFALVGLIAILAALAFGALLSGLQALKTLH